MVRSALARSSLLWVTPLLFGGCTSTAQLRAIDPQGTPVILHQEQNGSATVIDLQNLSGSGELVLKPASVNAWPKRLTLLVTPGAVHGLLVRTEAGLLFTPVADTDPIPKEVTLQPSFYSRGSQLTVRWQ